MGNSREDTTDRIYVPLDFVLKAGGGPEKIVEVIEPILRQYPEVIALLEFTSPGYNTRQIDCVLIGLGGVDLIEVKNKHGLVSMSADGIWSVQSSLGTHIIQNTKSGKSENPYQQALNTAQDFQQGLKKRLGKDIRVTPMVYLPSADVDSEVARHSNVYLVIGKSQFKSQLRSALRSKGGGWEEFDYHQLPKKLGLEPMRMAFVRGRVTSAEHDSGLEGIQLDIEINKHRIIVTTDNWGYYHFTCQLESNIEIGCIVPQKFEPIDNIALEAKYRCVQGPNFRLVVKPPSKTETQIREELTQEMQARIREHNLGTEAAWNVTQAQVQAVFDDLNRQLYNLQIQLNERERQLRQLQKNTEASSLTAYVLQERTQSALQSQQKEVAQALALLNSADASSLPEIFKTNFDLIVGITNELRRPLPSFSQEEPKVIHINSRERPMPWAFAEEDTDYEVQPIEFTEPITAADNSGQSPKKSNIWKILGSFVVLALASGIVWLLAGPKTYSPVSVQQSGAPKTNATTQVQEAPMDSDGKRLPGEAVPVPQKRTSSGSNSNSLPGIPLSK